MLACERGRVTLVAVLFLAGCSISGAVQKFQPLPKADMTAARLTDDQAACEKTAQEARSSATAAVLGAGWIGYNVAKGEYEMLYVECMRGKGYTFKEPLP